MKFVEVCDITIFMKSGNKINLDSVSVETTFHNNGNDITKISNWKQINAKVSLSLQTIALDQIEAVVFGKARNKFVW